MSADDPTDPKTAEVPAPAGQPDPKTAEVPAPAGQQSSWFGRVTDAYNMLWKMIIRPPRDVYSLEELGPAKFRLGKRIYERIDLQLESCRGHVLECSHFVPAKSPDAVRPCVVYLHGNCSSRLEAFDALPVLLPRDMTVFCMDLSGSGRSGGEYISLGHHEEKDLSTVLRHLRATGKVSSIGLWGRSMGAATSILRAAEDQDLAGCVLDSAFCDISTVAEELVNRGRIKVPQFILNMGLEVIRNEVKERAQFDLGELVPIKFAPKASCPAFFGVAQDDTFVLPHHTHDLHNVWKAERVLRVFDGGHNGVRPAWFLEEASDFLCQRLGKNDEFTEGDAAVNLDRSSSLDAPDETTPRPNAESSASKGATEPQGEAARRRHIVAGDLIKMGFGGDMAFEAAKRHSSTDDATAWLLHQPGSVAGAGEPGVSRPVRKNDDAAAQKAVTTGTASSGDATAATMVASSNGTVLERLRHLGFTDSNAQEAARRCPTLEDAVEWLVSQDDVVVAL